MGIRGLSSYLKQYYECDVFKRIRLHELQGKRVAIDSLVYLYKLKSSDKKNLMHLWFNVIVVLLRLQIVPVFVYDSGKVHPLKYKTNLRRRRKNERKMDNVVELQNMVKDYSNTYYLSHVLQQEFQRAFPSETQFNVDMMREYISRLEDQIVYIKRNDVESTIEMCRRFGVEVMVAPNESDKLCALLYQEGKVDYVISEDSDLIAYGCDVIRNFSFRTQFVTVCHAKDVLRVLKLDHESLLQFCILCGTDYNSNINHIGPSRALMRIQTQGNIESMVRLDDETRNHMLVVYDFLRNFDEEHAFMEKHKFVRDVDIDSLFDYLSSLRIPIVKNTLKSIVKF